MAVFNIAEATPGDADALRAVHAEALPPGWSASEIAAYCGGASRIALKALSGPFLCGFAILQFAADEAEVLTIGIEKDWRRQGAAMALLDAAIAKCRAKSIAAVYLEVAEDNRPARSLYEKFGFCVFARRENYYQSGQDTTALIMRLDTRPILSQVDRGASST